MIILQKYIAQAGYCSRRKAEMLIRLGKVKVGGEVAKLGQEIDENDPGEVIIEGKKLKLPEAKIYIKLNKPSGYTSTARPFKGEKNVFDLVKVKERLFIVGRLDKDSRGLLLLTNDGELANRLTHPKFEKEKEYLVEISSGSNRVAEKRIMEQLRSGVDIGEGDGIARAKSVKYLGGNQFSLVLTEGKKRQIRRMFRALGLQVKDLVRMRIGKLGLGNLKPGEWKYLDKSEIEKLNK